MSPITKMKKELSVNNFLLPAEWEAHEAVWLAWPHDKISFPPDHIQNVEKKYVEIIKAFSESERVHLLVLDKEMKTKISAMLKEKDIDISKIIFQINQPRNNFLEKMDDQGYLNQGITDIFLVARKDK